jgi:hypothetical protein
MHADHVLYLQRKMTDMGIAAHMEHMSEGRDREERSRPYLCPDVAGVSFPLKLI